MDTTIYKSASIDFLTKLHNRSYCLEFIDTLIKENREFSIFNIDLNKFKLVNDVYGHHIGDIVLEEVGQRFKSLEKEDLLFTRFGGDEFIGIYESVDEDKINELGQSIDRVFEEHIIISESEFTISASIGVVRHPFDSDDMYDLLKLSDMAMYKSKKSTSNSKYLISDELNKKFASRRKMEKLFKNIDIEKDLFLEYQPIFNFETGNLTSMEALVRWNHKTEGIIYPNDFIYLAEELDRIKDITRWVFVNGLKQIKEWNEKHATNYKLSLNVADACIHNKIFFGNVKSMLETFKVKAEWLSIELTERSLSISPEYMKPLLCSIDEAGIDIHLDNFGTHPIMIPDLKEFKIKEVKIDRKFISKLDNKDDLSIVRSMILLAKGLGIRTISKGVEKKEQYEVLKELGCDKIQGFYLEKPISKEAFEKKYFINEIK